jgi:hypothetical protein
VDPEELLLVELDPELLVDPELDELLVEPEPEELFVPLELELALEPLLDELLLEVDEPLELPEELLLEEELLDELLPPKEHEGTLPLPVTDVTVTPVPLGLTFELNTCTFANWLLVVALTSRSTFSSVTESGALELKPLNSDVVFDGDLVEKTPLTTMSVN